MPSVFHRKKLDSKLESRKIFHSRWKPMRKASFCVHFLKHLCSSRHDCMIPWYWAKIVIWGTEHFIKTHPSYSSPRFRYEKNFWKLFPKGLGRSIQVLKRCVSFQKDAGFLSLHITIDEIWQQLMEWMASRPKKFRDQKFARRVLALVFWDCQRVNLTDFLEKGKAITENCYLKLLTTTQGKIVVWRCFIFAGHKSHVVI